MILHIISSSALSFLPEKLVVYWHGMAGVMLLGFGL